MREIKFKAYLIDYKMVVPVEYINLFLNEIVVDVKGNQYEFELGEYKLLQYTGLKDVEQFDEPKELYTGDIVKMHQFLFDGGEYENEVVGVLTYDEDLACVCLTKVQQEDLRKYMGYGTKQEEFEKEKIPVCSIYGLHETSWTYLGNIFEDTHLLGDVK